MVNFYLRKPVKYVKKKWKYIYCPVHWVNMSTPPDWEDYNVQSFIRENGDGSYSFIKYDGRGTAVYSKKKVAEFGWTAVFRTKKLKKRVYRHKFSMDNEMGTCKVCSNQFKKGIKVTLDAIEETLDNNFVKGYEAGFEDGVEFTLAQIVAEESDVSEFEGEVGEYDDEFDLDIEQEEINEEDSYELV